MVCAWLITAVLSPLKENRTGLGWSPSGSGRRRGRPFRPACPAAARGIGMPSTPRHLVEGLAAASSMVAASRRYAP
jgi:hypothetical protein